jgi:asparagine synthase (glutamine-hydrolysing)
LTKIDIATMAHSLEARSPLLDQEFMELAASIPADRKARGSQRKIALRGALRGWIPDEVLDGRKQGFELPVASWLREDLAPYAREVLLDPAATERGWLDPTAVERLLDQHRAGTLDHGKRIWTLLNLELWARFATGRELAPTTAVAA